MLNENINKVYSLMARMGLVVENSSLLLEAMSVSDVYSKYYSNDISEEDFNKVVQADPTTPANGSKAGRFVKWLMNLYKSNNLKLEDLYKAKDYLSLYIKFNNKLPQDKKDINRIKSLPELFNIVKNFNDSDNMVNNRGELKKSVSKQLKESIEVYYNDNTLTVYTPRTREEAIAIGRGTEWCTSYDGENNMFDEYYKPEDPLYVVIYNSGSKYQFHFGSAQYMDSSDERINPCDLNLPINLIRLFAKSHPNIVYIYTNKDGLSEITITNEYFYDNYIVNHNQSTMLFLNDNFDEASINSSDEDDFEFIPKLSLPIEYLKMLSVNNNGLDLKAYNDELALYTFPNGKKTLYIQPLKSHTLFNEYNSTYYYYNSVNGFIYDSDDNEVEVEDLGFNYDMLDNIINTPNKVIQQKREMIESLLKELGNRGAIKSDGIRYNTKKEVQIINKYFNEYMDLFASPNIKQFYNSIYWFIEKYLK